MMKLSQRGALVGALAAAILCIEQSSAQTNVAPAAVSTNKVDGTNADLFPDPVVAKGNGFQIKRSQVDDALVAYKANFAARNPGGEPSIPNLEANLLNKLVVTDILLGKATAEDKTNATELTETYLAKAKASFPSEDIFIAQVKASGLTLEQFRARILEQNTCETVLNRELRSKIKISDAEAKKFYDDNPSEFEQKEQVRASHILISTLDKTTQQPLPEDQKKEKEKLAKELKARAEKGEDFAKLAKEYSDDPGSKDKGGEYTFPRGQMVKEFETAAFALQTNQVSEIVETRYGYHIIKLSEKIPASTMEFDKISPKLKEYLTDREFAKQLPAYLEKIKAESKVEILDPKLVLPKREEEASPSSNAPATK